MNSLDAQPSEAEAPEMLEANNQPSIEVTSDSIWRLTEEVLLSLRAQATNQLRKQKRAGGLWLDDVTRAQARTIIAVRQLSETSPEGVTLKKLADTTGVTAAAASVMVDLLVKKMLKRTRSKSDRRSVLIRLDQDTATLFEITEQSLRQSVTSIGEELGPEKLREWHEILGRFSNSRRMIRGMHRQRRSFRTRRTRMMGRRPSGRTYIPPGSVRPSGASFLQARSPISQALFFE